MKTDKDFITWFHKKIIDLMYDNKISVEVWKLFQDLVKEWQDKNKRQRYKKG